MFSPWHGWLIWQWYLSCSIRQDRLKGTVVGGKITISSRIFCEKDSRSCREGYRLLLLGRCCLCWHSHPAGWLPLYAARAPLPRDRASGTHGTRSTRESSIRGTSWWVQYIHAVIPSPRLFPSRPYERELEHDRPADESLWLCKLLWRAEYWQTWRTSWTLLLVSSICWSCRFVNLFKMDFFFLSFE